MSQFNIKITLDRELDQKKRVKEEEERSGDCRELDQKSEIEGKESAYRLTRSRSERIPSEASAIHQNPRSSKTLGREGRDANVNTLLIFWENYTLPL
jgi:hypothetical protein